MSEQKKNQLWTHMTLKISWYMTQHPILNNHEKISETVFKNVNGKRGKSIVKSTIHKKKMHANNKDATQNNSSQQGTKPKMVKWNQAEQ